MRRAAPSAMSKADTREPLLQIVAAERENDEVNRRVAHEARRQRLHARAIGLDRIVVNGRAAAQPLRDHFELRPEFALHHGRPALRAGEPRACRRVEAPGVGIAKRDNDRHRLRVPSLIARHPRRRQPGDLRRTEAERQPSNANRAFKNGAARIDAHPRAPLRDCRSGCG